MNANAKLKLMTLIAISLAISSTYYAIKAYHPPQGINIPIPKVVVQKPKLAMRADYIQLTGNTVAYNAVNLVARVEGYLDKIEFTDGTFVKKNQELFVIEPQPYLEKLKAAQASVVAQKSGFAYASAEYARQQQMYKQNATSLNNVEKWLARYDESQAEVDKAIADASIAAINYSYTHILAPFDGRIGRHLVDIGNLVGKGKATNLAIIEQIDPIYVYFNLNELDLIKLRQAAQANNIKEKQIYHFPIAVGLQNETDFPHKGHLDFVNTSLNASMGTIVFRALLPNKDYALLPGAFVRVRIPIDKPRLQLTIPAIAVQYDQIGAYVMVVNNNNYVVLKRVNVGSIEEGLQVILQGLTAQDVVIVSGLQNAIPGHQVNPKVA